MLSFKELAGRIDTSLSRHGDLGARLVKGVLGIAGVRILHAGVGFVTTALLARMLAPGGYGVYSYAMALIMFLTIPSELGIPGVAVREIAVTNVRRDWGHMMGFILRAHQAIAILAVVLMSAGYAVLFIWGDGLSPAKRNCIALAFLLIPFVSFGALRTAMLRGLRKVVLGEIPENIVRPLVFLAFIVLLTAFGREFVTPVSVMALQVSATAAAFWSGLHLFFKNRPAELSGAEPSYKTSFWLKSSVPFALTAALQLINGRTDILMLGIFREDSDVGIYRVATQTAALVVFGLRVINSIQGPHIAHLYAEGDIERLQTLVTKSSRVVVLATLPVVLVIFLFGEFIIKAVFGPKYVGAYIPLLILCIGQLVNAITGSVASLLNMTGHERDTMQSALAGAVTNIVLNVTLTPMWGMNGAAAATAATLIVWNVMMWHKVRKRLGIEASPFFRGRR